VINEIKWERSEKLDSIFPHIYGEINTDAVFEVLNMNFVEGEFVLNPELEEYLLK
jgi:uncharacterized protein (DUF952 family)